jgi:hypothetical protein
LLIYYVFHGLQEFADGHGFGGGQSSRNRLEEASESTGKILSLRLGGEAMRIKELIMQYGVISIWGIAGLGKSSLVRSEYYNTVIANLKKPDSLSDRVFAAMHGEFTKYSWVDVPNPFSLAEFARRLFLDFHSDDNQAKQTTTIGMVEG